MKEKPHTTISFDIERAFDKMLTLSHDKNKCYNMEEAQKHYVK